MGMYTAISLGVKLNIKKHSPEAKLLRYMVSGDEPARGDLNPLPNHPFFGASRWAFMLHCDSYYFDYQTHWSFEWDCISRSYYLSGQSNLKNYGNEIKSFLDWLTPYIETTGFIGWTMYEEQSYPDLITRGFRSGELYYTRTEHFVNTDMANQINDLAQESYHE